MRDISSRIRRYRLSRYGPGDDPVRRWARWALPLAALWLVYVVVLSDHSLIRIWRLSVETARTRAELEATSREIARLHHEMRDPDARRERGERVLRERDGLGRSGEIVYRIPAPADSGR